MCIRDSAESETPPANFNHATPLATALDDWLRPLELTWRYAGAGLIEVTTPESELSRFEIGFHSVGDLIEQNADPDTLIEQLKSAIGNGRFLEEGGQGVMFFDSATSTLIVRLPQSQQVGVDWLLSSLRPS